MLACFVSLWAHVLHACCGQISYMLTCLRASYIIFSVFFGFEKLTFKNPYIEKFEKRFITHPPA